MNGMRKLRMQGLTPGTEAYNNAMQNLTRVQSQQQNQLANQAVVTGNSMANQNYASALAGYGAQNSAQGQAFDQGMSRFGASNSALGQQFNQSLAGYGANTSAQQAANAAQQQAYEQAMGRYNTAYQSKYNEYMMPLNSMNAVLTGQQVQSPTMPSFATAGYTGGPDMLGATSALGSWNQGLYNAQAAGNNGTNGLLGTGMMAAATYF